MIILWVNQNTDLLVSQKQVKGKKYPFYFVTVYHVFVCVFVRGGGGGGGGGEREGGPRGMDYAACKIKQVKTRWLNFFSFYESNA